MDRVTLDPIPFLVLFGPDRADGVGVEAFQAPLMENHAFASGCSDCTFRYRCSCFFVCWLGLAVESNHSRHGCCDANPL
jgi:hypothetical protein